MVNRIYVRRSKSYSLARTLNTVITLSLSLFIFYSCLDDAKKCLNLKIFKSSFMLNDGEYLRENILMIMDRDETRIIKLSFKMIFVYFIQPYNLMILKMR